MWQKNRATSTPALKSLLYSVIYSPNLEHILEHSIIPSIYNNLCKFFVNPNHIRGGGGGDGQFEQCGVKISEKCLSSHHINTALIKQISLFDTAICNIIYLKFQFTIIFLSISETAIWLNLLPPPLYITTVYFIPIWVGLINQLVL